MSEAPLREEPLRPWTVESSRILREDPWLKLRADRCVTQRGAVLDPFYVFEYRDWVHVVAFDEDDRILFVRQYRHGFGGMSLELPGGIVDAHETDPLQAARRELLEETGYVAESFTHLAALSPNPSTHTNRLHVALAEGARFSRAPAPDATEDLRVEKLTQEEAIARAVRGDIVNAGHVGLLFVALERRRVNRLSAG
jgi:8-oxo-dGTP pyrophosphatase MutT (NUDIX family)